MFWIVSKSKYAFLTQVNGYSFHHSKIGWYVLSYTPLQYLDGYRTTRPYTHSIFRFLTRWAIQCCWGGYRMKGLQCSSICSGCKRKRNGIVSEWIFIMDVSIVMIFRVVHVQIDILYLHGFHCTSFKHKISQNTSQVWEHMDSLSAHTVSWFGMMPKHDNRDSHVAEELSKYIPQCNVGMMF